MKHDSKTAWYYGFEAKGIGQYVLGHRKLKRLLGASAIVRRLVTNELVGVLEAVFGVPDGRQTNAHFALLLNAAGRARIRFTTGDELRRFLAVWPLYVAERAPHLRTAQAWVPDQGSEEATRFKLREALQRAQMHPPIDLPAGNPVTERSPVRKLPAEALLAAEDDGGGLIDAAERNAITESDRSRRHDELSLAHEIFGQQSSRGGFRFPRDLNEMTAGHYIAVIHADGNGIGRRFQALPTFEDAKTLSGRLASASRLAVAKAVNKHLEPEKDDKCRHLLGVPVVFGGDDLVMIVRADKAVGFLETYSKAFEQALGDVEISAGIAFVRANHAFHQALDLAESLCERTKNATGRQFSAMSFYRFTDLLEPEPPLYGCPYRLTGPAEETKRLESVRAVAKRLKDRKVARGSVRAMLTAIEDERDQDFLDAWARFQVVHRRRKGEPWLKELNDELTAARTESAAERGIKRDKPRPTTGGGKLRLQDVLPDVNTLAVVQEVIDG